MDFSGLQGISKRLTNHRSEFWQFFDHVIPIPQYRVCASHDQHKLKNDQEILQAVKSHSNEQNYTGIKYQI